MIGGTSAADAGQPAWLTVRSPGFIVVFHPEHRKLAEEILARAPMERARIAADLGRDSNADYEVRLADGPSDFQEAQPGGNTAPVWASGIAYPGLHVIVLQLRSGTGRGLDEVYSTFTHELSHMMLHGALDGRRAPRWLSEGLAMYHAGEWSFNRLAVITRAVAFKNIIPLEKLERSFPDDARDASLAYAESVEFVAFLLGRYGRPAMNGFIAGLAGGQDTGAALASSFGEGLGGLEEQWLSKARFKYAWLPLITSSVTLWFLISLIFLAGYARKRAESRRRLKQMEQEELLLFDGAVDGADDVSDETNTPGVSEQPGARKIH
ncbi:MAG: peptidase MA family metallohydrolase [Myxococcota bacterium]